MSAQAARDYPRMIETIAGPPGRFPNRERWLATAADRARLSRRTVRGLFYGEITDPKTSVTDRLEAAVAACGMQERAAREEIGQVKQELGAIGRMLAQALAGRGDAAALVPGDGSGGDWHRARSGSAGLRAGR